MIEAVNNYVTVDLVEYQKKGLYMPDKFENSNQRWGTVTSIGPGHPDIGGSHIPLPLEVGDTVYCMAHGLYEIEDVTVVSEFDIMGKATIQNEKFINFQPLGNLILVQPAEKITISGSGLHLPEKAQKSVVKGTVLKLGTGWKNLDGSDIPFHVEEGQEIWFLPEMLMKVRGDLIGVDEDLYLVAHSNIVVKRKI